MDIMADQQRDTTAAAVVVDVDGMARACAACVDARTPTSDKDLGDITESADQLLARIDAYGGLLQALTMERQEMETATLPMLKANCDRLVELFHKIDQIEAVVNIVRGRMQDVEAELNAVDKKPKSTSVVTGMFRSLRAGFLGRRSASPSSSSSSSSSSSAPPPGGIAVEPDPNWQPPQLWSTPDIFPATTPPPPATQ
ncbi:hypothetical protein PTSG_11338 [Salpingoeca rosetta]|uniref:Biogenesis of lysosome-related organelles complex 1 subunit 4 n=1 Tax=Salpingoeca rosetta (strain ATCC 50818 / BSB-021) TaxID=946362 RepID=F2UT42_SALR5|nr:uncharacterized protein PTSG_11338 [Salpingoeca rosetta]EGD81301.1 hypothetical protein PTSG_11338 [Salpingoeca rosetta]|eukprot:XP_004987697.1 hypothetical protein PTSG_11338 [Salpingoeca rosetta]